MSSNDDEVLINAEHDGAVATATTATTTTNNNDEGGGGGGVAVSGRSIGTGTGSHFSTHSFRAVCEEWKKHHKPDTALQLAFDEIDADGSGMLKPSEIATFCT